MSFGTTASTTPDKKKLGGLDPTKVNSTQRATPLPYFVGRTKLGVTWLGKALRQKAENVKDAGGGKSSGASTSHKYYADLMGIVCHGPVDALVEVWLDDDLVWKGTQTTRDASQGRGDSASINIDDRGPMTIYWGTETQNIDPLLAAAGHTAYRGQCYLVFPKFCLGTDSSNAPNVSVVVKRQPATNIGALTAPPQIGSSTNPVHCAVELLSNQRFGGGFDPLACFDLTQLNTAAAQLAAEGLGLSVQITDVDNARNLLASLCEYLDGWIECFKDDLFRLRLTRSNQTATDALPLLGEYDLLDVPEITPQGWPDTYNQVAIKFTNADEGFQDDSATWYDQANLACTAAPRANSLDRSWIDNLTLANQLAAYYGRLYSVPHLTGKLSFRKEAVALISVGDFFRLSYRDFNDTVVFRVTGRNVDKDRSQAVTLEVEADRYFDDVLAYTPEHAPAGDTLPIEPEPVLFGRVIEMPYDLVPSGADRTRPHVAVVAARQSGLDTKLKVFSSEDGLTYDRLAATRDFALHSTLAVPYPAGTTLLDDSDAGILVNVDGPDIEYPSVTEGQWLRNKLLLFIDNEILSYRQADLVGANQVRFRGIRRACSDTFAADHAQGAHVLMIQRKELLVISDEFYETTADVYLKLATATLRGTLDLSGLERIEMLLANRTARPLPPINLRVNHSGTTSTYQPGSDVAIGWDITNWRRNNFLASWDSPFVDEFLTHKIKIYGPDGSVVRKVPLAAGIDGYTYAAADLVADMGVPESFRVSVFSRYRGQHSFTTADRLVTRSS